MFTLGWSAPEVFMYPKIARFSCEEMNFVEIGPAVAPSALIIRLGLVDRKMNEWLAWEIEKGASRRGSRATWEYQQWRIFVQRILHVGVNHNHF